MRLAAVLIFVNFALAQIHGSVGVVHLGKDEISIAADSRGIGFGNKLFDTMCKVTNLGDDLVFVTSGTILFADEPGFKGWNNIDEARSVYKETASKYGGARGHVQEIVDRWTKNISAKFDDLGRSRPNLFGGSVVPGSGDFTVAMFGGQDSAGTLVLYGAQILPDPNRPLATKHVAGQIACDVGGFCGVGSMATTNEFASARTERAKKEQSTWMPPGPYAPGSVDYMMFRTIRMVELTIQYRTAAEVGGPIDAVQFRRMGAEHVHWYAHKTNCEGK